MFDTLHPLVITTTQMYNSSHNKPRSREGTNHFKYFQINDNSNYV